MNIQIKTTQIELTPAIRGYVEQKIGSLRKMLQAEGESVRVEVEIGKTTAHHQKGEVFRAEINLHLPTKNLRTVSETYDLYGAIDIASDSMFDEITSFQGKKVTLFRKGARTVKSILKGLRFKR